MILEPEGSFSNTNLLTFDITFVFYDGIAIDHRCSWLVHNVDTRRRLRMWRDVTSTEHRSWTLLWRTDRPSGLNETQMTFKWTSTTDAKDVVTSKVDKVDINRQPNRCHYIYVYAWNKKRKSGSLIICIQYCDILFW